MSAKLRASSSASKDMRERGGSLVRPTESRSPALVVHVVAYIWGLTADDQDRAEQVARWGWSRRGWDFVAIGRSADDVCPVNLRDGKALAAESGRGWAYVVYPASGAINLIETHPELRDVLTPIVALDPIGASDA